MAEISPPPDRRPLKIATQGRSPLGPNANKTKAPFEK